MSGPLIAALEVLHAGDMAAVGARVASLAWQRLRELPTSLLWDLAWLVADGLEGGDEQQVALYGGLLRHYVASAAQYTPELLPQLQAAAGAGAKKKRAVPGAPPGGAQQQPEGQLRWLQQAAALPLQRLAGVVLQQPDAGAPAGSPPLPAGCRREAMRLAVRFRAGKKQLLTDVQLAAPVPVRELEQQAALLAAFRESAAVTGVAISSSDSDGEGTVLPWQRA